MATPSITMIPSGYKPEKVYSVLPTNGDGDLFFDRNTPATRVNKDGLIEQLGTDVPTLDYSDGSCPSLLLERYSLNLALYSEDFTNTFWATGGTIRTSGFLSPSGELNACLVKAAGSNYMASSGMSLISSRTYTLSVYLKASTPTTITLKLQELGGDYTNYFSPEITLTNEWVRYEVTGQKGADGNPARIVFNNISDSEEFYVWGAQLEEQPYATSYIPTTSETASRSGDSFSKTGLSSYISSTAGVLYAEIASLSTGDNTQRVISLNDGGNINRVLIGFSRNGTTYAAINNQPVAYFTPTDPTVFHKVAIKYEDNNTKFFVNGNQIGSTETTQTVPSGLSQIKSTSGLNSDRFFGKVKDLRVYNTLLTDLELKELTTI